MTLLIPAAFLAALSVATHWAAAPHAALLPLALASLTLAFARRAAHTIFAIAFLVAALGILRVTLGTPQPSPLAQLVSEHEVTALRGEVTDDPSPRDRAQLVRLRVNATRLPTGEWRVVDGSAQLATRLVPTLHHGDFIEARGSIQPPEAGNEPGYAAYLRRQGIDAVATFPFIEQRGERIVGSTSSTGSTADSLSGQIYDRIVHLRRASVGALERLLPEPHAALAQGILLGRRATMPAEVTEQMRNSGLSHVTAVSGYNLSILIAASVGLVGLAPTTRRWRRLTGVLLGSILLWCFVALVGASGSVLRAAAMAQIVLIGIALGRRGTAGGMLLWGSALLALWKPDVVTDVGWQLSFLGTAGLAWCAAPIERGLARLLPLTDPTGPNSAGGPMRVTGHFGPALAALRSSFSSTLAAQVFVFPVLASVFGSFSLAAPLSNVLALPLVPWIMLATFLATVSDLIVAPAAPLFASLAWVPLTLLLRIVDWTATLPWASVEIPPLTPLGVILSLAFLTALCVREEIRMRQVSPDEAREAAGSHEGAAAASALGSPLHGAPMPLRQRLALTLAVSLGALALVGAAMTRPAPSLADSSGALILELPAVEDGTLLLAQSPDGSRLLIDGGPTAGGAAALLGRYLTPWDRTVDAIVLVDPRESHLLGLPRVLDRYRVGLIADVVDTYPSGAYRQLRDAVTRARVQHVPLEGDSSFSLGGTTGTSGTSGSLRVTPLRPAQRPDGAAFPVPLHITWGSFSALLPGDATPAQLRALLSTDHDLHATLLILPERLLRYPETTRLLTAVDPELVITQGDPAPATTHPPPDTALPTVWHRTSLDGPARLHVYPDGTYTLRP